MRLTLKRLLDYGEDRLSPEQTRELGQILAEHPDAAKLVQVLEKAGKGPRLPRGEEETKVPLAQLALYLDDRMDSAAELEFEKRAYRDPELLGEIARCHEALSRSLPVPNLVDPTGKGEGLSILSWPGGQLNLPRLFSVVDGSLPDEEAEAEIPAWKSPYFALEKHIFDKNPDRFGGLEWENARGWLWRSILVGICLIILAGGLTFFNDRDKWDWFANFGKTEKAKPNPTLPRNLPDETKKGESKDPLVKDNRPPKTLPVPQGGGEKALPDPTRGKRDEETGKKPVPPDKPKEALPNAEAGQTVMASLVGSPVESMPNLVWAGSGELRKLKEGNPVSWGRDLWIPPGFAGVVDSKAGWKVAAFGNFPSLTGREHPLGARFRFEPGLGQGKPALRILEGRVEILGTLEKPEDTLVLRIYSQELRINSLGKFHLFIEAIPRPPKSDEIDWTLIVVQGTVRLLESVNEPPVIMMASPGLCLARHSPAAGVSMEKKSRPPSGLLSESVKGLTRYKEFSAAAGEILSSAKEKIFDSGELVRLFGQPASNVAKKGLLVYLGAWIGDFQLPLKAIVDGRPSMKELREASILALGQLSRDQGPAWDKAFQAGAGGTAPMESVVPGETQDFKRFVEAIGKGEFSPLLVNRALDLLLDGKSLGTREVAYQYLKMVNSPDEGPRYDPAEPEAARKLTQAEWKRFVKGESGAP